MALKYADPTNDEGIRRPGQESGVSGESSRRRQSTNQQQLIDWLTLEFRGGPVGRNGTIKIKDLFGTWEDLPW